MGHSNSLKSLFISVMGTNVNHAKLHPMSNLKLKISAFYITCSLELMSMSILFCATYDTVTRQLVCKIFYSIRAQETSVKHLKIEC